MAEYFRKQVIPGVFILLALVMVVYFIFTIKPSGMMSQTYEISVVFDSIAGLRENATVWFAGVEKYQGIDVGRVKRIKIISTTRPNGSNMYQIEVKLEINKAIPLKEDSQFRIATKGLAGYPHVEIIPGPPDSPDIPHDRALKGITPPDDMFTTMQELSDIVKAMELDKLGPKIHRAIQNIGDVGEELNLIATDVGDIVHDIKEKQQIQSIVNNINLVSQEAISTVEQTQELIKKFDSTVLKVSGILDENREDIRTIVTNLTAMSARLDTQLDQILTRTNTMLAEIDSFLGDNKDEISAILINLRATTQNVKMFTQDIKRNPWKLFFRTKEKKAKDLLKPRLDKGPVLE